jgi:hypothetical protein
MTKKQADNYWRLMQRLAELGFTHEESEQLRRIEMTLHRWCEQECGDSNDFNSWAIERDEATGKPYRCVYPHTGKMHRTPIADREAGALRRLKAIMAKHPALLAHYQTDCRGCALYIVHRPGLHEGGPKELRHWVEQNYTRGIAVAA